MAAEELSHDEIDNLFSGNDDKQDGIDSFAKGFANLLNASVEEVLKTAFSLELVSKFIDLIIKNRDDLSFDEGIYANIEIASGENKIECRAHIKQEFASILSDLMLMGPGESKEKLEPDDLDSLKEMFSQIFGNFQSTFKEKQNKEISVNIQSVTDSYDQLDGDSFYSMTFDIAIPNIKSDAMTLFVEKSVFDEFFAEKEQNMETESNKNEVPFEGIEEIEKPDDNSVSYDTQSSPNNLGLIMDVDLDLKIRIGEKNMLIKDLLTLKEGSIVELEKNIEEPLDILINNKVIAKGVVVVVRGHFGIKITNIDTKEERIKSLGE